MQYNINVTNFYSHLLIINRFFVQYSKKRPDNLLVSINLHSVEYISLNLNAAYHE